MRARIELDEVATKEIWLAAVREAARGDGAVLFYARSAAVGWANVLDAAAKNTIPHADSTLAAAASSAKLSDSRMSEHALGVAFSQAELKRARALKEGREPWPPTVVRPYGTSEEDTRYRPWVESAFDNHVVRFEWADSYKATGLPTAAFPIRCIVDLP